MSLLLTHISTLLLLQHAIHTFHKTCKDPDTDTFVLHVISISTHLASALKLRIMNHETHLDPISQCSNARIFLFLHVQF